MRHNTNTTSLKGLKKCKTAIETVINESAYLSTGIEIIQKAAEDFGVEIDGPALEECRQMLITFNRLMYRQLSDLKHRQMMQIASEAAARSIAKYHTVG